MSIATPLARGPLDGRVIEIVRSRSQVYAACPSLGLHATGETAETAITALQDRFVARGRFEAESGLSLPMVGRLPRARIGQLKRGAMILLVSGLIAMQLSYAVSTGISRGIGRGFSADWRDGLLASVEQQLLAASTTPEPLDVERQRRLIGAVHALKVRYGPIWDEIVRERLAKPIGTSNDGAR